MSYISGHYHYKADEWCADCLPVSTEHPEVDYHGPHDWEQDTPAHCCECRALLPCNLTSAGVRYVLEYLADATRDGEATEVEKEWAAMLADYCLDYCQQSILDCFNHTFGATT